jgi:dUTP pyrophosphatase
MDRRKENIMEKEELERYIKKLEELEKNFSAENLEDFNPKFMDELNDVLNVINDDMLKETMSKEPTYTPSETGVVVKVKKLENNAVIPSYSKIGDAGMDLTITSIIENSTESITYGFGIAIEIPKGYVGLIFPRSSIRKYDISLTNSVGVIDSGYRGEIQATFRKHDTNAGLIYNPSERGAQILILPYPQIYMTQVPELSDSDRGAGGFGSTGV